MSIINGRQVGGGAPLKTMTLVDENGLELLGIVVDKEVIFDADPMTDIREGKVAATDVGVVVGEKVIPSYHISHGTKIVPSGGNFLLNLPHLNKYDYTVFHGIICAYNTNLSDSVAANYVSVLDATYPVQSTEAIASIVKDHDGKNINLGFTNNTGSMCILRYMTYKEID